MTATATASPRYRSMLISLMWTLMSSRANRRLCGHGQPPTASIGMNMSITIWTTSALR